MKEFDLVKLVNANKYLDRGLYKDIHGIVLNVDMNGSNILFFNETNIGEAIVVNVLNDDLIVEKEKLPETFIKEIIEKLDIEKLIQKPKLEVISLKAYDYVELLVEDENYSKYGLHKGETGCVLEGGIIRGKCLVDFTGIDKTDQVYGSCIMVNIKDLKKI